MINRIKIKAQYQPSTSLLLDRSNKSLLDGFIPTYGSLDVLEYLIRPALAMDKGTFRSHLLTGAYGKGKSYSVLVALSFLSGQCNDKYDDLVDKVSRRRDYLALWLKELQSKAPLLPVVVRGGYPSLSLALSAALVQALDSEGIKGLSPNNNFDRAIEYLHIWRVDFPEAFDKLVDLLGGQERYHSFFTRLNQYDEKVLAEFVSIFPKLTNGSEFNRISELHLVEDIKDIALRISSVGFRGLYIVYDEFSKYLEGQRGRMTESDIRLLQDLAELANGSTIDAQVHLLLVSHKVPTSYFTDEVTIHEWEAISGRFDQKDLHNLNDQEYEILENILDIDDSYRNDVKKFIYSTQEHALRNLETSCISRGLFTNTQFDSLFYSCLPLHPITTYILPRLSERIAQNERSLFTFIVSKDANSLTLFLQRNEEFRFLGVWNLFDYFRPLFRNVSPENPIFRIELMVTTIEKRLHDKNELAIWATKTIAILLILNDQKLRPTFDTLTQCFYLLSDSKGRQISSSDLSSAVESVINFGALRVSVGTDEYLPFAINVTMNNEIKNLTRLKEKKINVFFDLEKYGFSYAAYPIEFNDEKCISRYFHYSYFDASHLKKIHVLRAHYQSITKHGDGVVFCYLDDPSEDEAIISFAEEVSSWELSIVLIPKLKQKNSLKQNIAQLSVLDERQSKPLSVEDKTIIEVLKQDTHEAIEAILEPFIHPSDDRVSCFIEGRQKACRSENEFSHFCSEEFFRIFSNTPRINREDLNLNYLSKVSRNARDVVVQCILEGSNERLNEFKDTSQPQTLFRSIKGIFAILIQEDGSISFDKRELDNDISLPIELITNFFLDSAEGEKNLAELLDKLASPKGRIGLKKGPIPLFLAIVCNRFNRKIIFKRNDREVFLSAALLHAICEEPEEYSVSINEWDCEKEQYIATLCEYFDVHDMGHNILKVLAEAFISWWEQIPLIVRSIKGILVLPKCEVADFSGSTAKLITLIETYNGNPYSFFMEKIPVKIGKKGPIGTELAKSVIACCLEIDNAYRTSLAAVQCFIANELYGADDQRDWLVRMHSWVDALPNHIEHNVSTKIRLIVKSLQEPGHDSDKIFRVICESLAGMRFSDWGKATTEIFRTSIEEILNEIQGLQNVVVKQKDINNYVLSITSSLGQHGLLTIPVEASDEKLSRMVTNEIESIFVELGSALTRTERNRILLQLMMK